MKNNRKIAELAAKKAAGIALTTAEKEFLKTEAQKIQPVFFKAEKIAEILKISRQAADKKIKQGCLVKSADELYAWNNERNKLLGQGSKAPPDLNSARHLKLKLEGELLQFRLSREKGEYISTTQVREDIIAAVSALTAELYAMANDVPGQLAGLTETQIRDKMLTRIDLLVDKVKEKWAALGEARMQEDKHQSN